MQEARDAGATEGVVGRQLLARALSRTHARTHLTFLCRGVVLAWCPFGAWVGTGK